MPIYTTYLAFLRKAKYNPLNIFPHALKETLIYYVMRNRGNNAVAPRKNLLDLAKKGLINWKGYERSYLKELRSPFDSEPDKWMMKVAEESKRANVVLVCYEKDARFCHRRLLAEEISWRCGAQYEGELTVENIKQV